eukprot:scaffold24240_cov129-Isochrysis_galbana.AAC.4
MERSRGTSEMPRLKRSTSTSSKCSARTSRSSRSSFSKWNQRKRIGSALIKWDDVMPTMPTLVMTPKKVMTLSTESHDPMSSAPWYRGRWVESRSRKASARSRTRLLTYVTRAASGKAGAKSTM